MALRYGSQLIKVDLESLRKAVNQGEIFGTEIIEHVELLKIVRESNYPDFQKWKALKFITDDHEMLIKGIIPARYLEIGK